VKSAMYDDKSSRQQFDRELINNKC